ncbi:MAG: hypothetical protein OXQ29_18015 [Rhodospirillaceae bacterium]|nr:hypothetical protein [Rhodospirillaceae bacterium]
MDTKLTLDDIIDIATHRIADEGGERDLLDMSLIIQRLAAFMPRREGTAGSSPLTEHQLHAILDALATKEGNDAARQVIAQKTNLS